MPIGRATMRSCAAYELPLVLVLMACRRSDAWQKSQAPFGRGALSLGRRHGRSRHLSALPELAFHDFMMPLQELGHFFTATLADSSAVPASESVRNVEGLLQVKGAAAEAEAYAEAGEAALQSLGRDGLTFLAASVAVVPLSRWLGVTPVLGFLVTGCLLGPHGLGLFANTEADLELGDFGILFLLFSEGLNLSPERLGALGAFSGLGVLQILTSMFLFFFGILLGGPIVLNYIAPVLQMDDFISEIFSSPVQAFCIAAAGALSSSAFVLPVLKEKKWEEKPEGIAALAVLLLQDLAVAPLLVILPLLAGVGPQSSAELGILAAKATFGFGAVLAAGSVLLRYVFDIVAAARSTETFVATALLVALGMGQAAEYLGLSATTGAFAAGVLLAGNRYRAQIKADIRPFEGILLGIFFLTAGASLDPYLVVNEFPTLFTGISVFIITKALVLFVAGPALGKTWAGAARVAITLSGGGEFSLVLFKVAQQLGVLSDQLAHLLTASVIISMSLTPLLGEIADAAGNYLESLDDSGGLLETDVLTAEDAQALFDMIDVDSSGTIDFDELRLHLLNRGLSYLSISEIFVKFDENGDGIISREEWMAGLRAGYLASALAIGGEAVDVVAARKEAGLTQEIANDAIVICGYSEFGKEMYSVLKAAGATRNGGVVAFELNPSRVTAGILSGDTVIYGDGASADLMRAAGVANPKAVVVAFRSEARRLEAIERLSEGLPPGTRIYARVVSGQSLGRRELIGAGATDVVDERAEAALRFGVLLGAFARDDAAEMRAEIATIEEEESPIPGISEDRLDGLVEEFGCTRHEVVRLFKVFSSLPPNFGSDQFVDIVELRDLLLRTDEAPITDEALQRWMEFADIEGGHKLSFVDFARVFFGSPGQVARE